MRAENRTSLAWSIRHIADESINDLLQIQCAQTIIRFLSNMYNHQTIAERIPTIFGGIYLISTRQSTQFTNEMTNIFSLFIID